MKKTRIKKTEAGNYRGAIFVSLILVLSVITFATPTLSENLPPKTIYGTASRCDGGSVSGASVLVSSSLGSRSTACSGAGSWNVDVGSESSEEWPDGTSFTVTITMSGWSGTTSGTVSGYTNAGNVNLNPTTSLSASANANPLTVLVGDTVSFTGSASGGATPYTWSWDFNGEGSSTQQSPTFSFGTPGSKNCVLTVTDACSSIDTDSVTVTVNPALSGSGGGPYSGDVCNPVSFSGSASGGIPPYTYSWAFSDGGSASGQSPTHQFTSDGSYTATLTITDSDSPPNNYICSPASVTISTATLVADAGGPYSGDVCNPVSFSGSATGGCTPYTYSWAFSDGGSASGQNPTHQFTSDGSYTATVTVTSADGQSDPDTASVTISTATLVADAGGPYSGIINSAVQFYGSATGGCTPYTYSWAFSDGGSASGQNPTHQFSAEGDYTATVTVISSDGQSDTDMANVHIDESPLTADAHGPYEGGVGQEIAFFGSATGGTQPYSWYWDFGDGYTSSLQYPTYAYSEAGTYIVTLTVRDSSSPQQQHSDITNAVISSEDRPIADANGDYEGEVGEEIEFEGDVYGGTAPYEWFWEFGDGNTSDERNPVHVYSEPGEYIVNLTVTDDNGYSDLDNATCTIIPPNDPPVKPSMPSGKTSGKAGTEYTYTSSTTDPDGDALYYLWDWGDGTDSGWLGPYGNGETVSASHTWDEQSSYEVKVKAKDTHGEESPWSDPLPISMPKSRFSHLISILEQLIEQFPILEWILSLPIFKLMVY